MDETFLSRREAADYTKQKFGAPGAIAYSTLAKLAVIGGGPVFYRFGKKIGYLPSELDKWVSSRKSQLNNTSDMGGAHAA